MQAALVPDIPEQLGALGLSVAYRPADGPAAGGDFYDAFALDGGRVAVIVGDVSGHGRTALARAAHMHYTLRAYVETGLDPRASLKLAGRVLGTEGDGLFTTVAIAIYDPASATLTYATAGHPAPVVLGDDAGEPVFGAASPALGWGLPTGLRQTTLPFGAGDPRVLLQRRRHRGRAPRTACSAASGWARCSRRPVRASEPPELLERVRAEATAVNDDMAACVIEAREGARGSSDRIEELEANADALAAGQGERFLHACGVVTTRGRGRGRARARAWPAPTARRSCASPATPDGPVVTAEGAPSLVLGTPAPLDGAPADADGRRRPGRAPAARRRPGSGPDARCPWAADRDVSRGAGPGTVLAFLRQRTARIVPLTDRARRGRPGGLGSGGVVWCSVPAVSPLLEQAHQLSAVAEPTLQGTIERLAVVAHDRDEDVRRPHGRAATVGGDLAGGHRDLVKGLGRRFAAGLRGGR